MLTKGDPVVLIYCRKALIQASIDKNLSKAVQIIYKW